MAILSVWTSGLTSRLELETEKQLGESGAEALDSLNIVSCSEDEISKRLNEKFNQLVVLTSSDPTLHIIAVVPLFGVEAVSEIRKLTEACNRLEHNISLHIIGLCAGLSNLFEKQNGIHDLVTLQRRSEEELIRQTEHKNYPVSYTLIDDYASNGASIGFTLSSLSRYISLIIQALGQNYYTLLSPALLSAHQGKNLSLGVSSLRFPKEATVRRLLGLGFLAALDNVGINETEVDSQKAAHEAEMFLEGISTRYPKLYEKSIRPLYKDKGMSEGKAVAEASDIIKKDLDQLRGDIERLLKNEEFTFPEKEAILAMILGRDNANLAGVQYEHEGTILDDGADDPINLYVKAYNDYCLESKWLPVRGDYNSLKIKIWDPIEGKYEDVPENHEALNPLPDIKRLKQQILNTTSFLREKQEELSRLKETTKVREDAKEILRQWKKPEGNLTDFEYKEQPLDEKYVPAANLKIQSSVDLRSFFLPVRNQSDLGSCTSFAVTAMYEAMMTRGGMKPEDYMSPGYLFYYSNILKGRPQGGSNYHDQLEVMGKHGDCFETFYTYNASAPSKTPSKEAEEDAKKHRVLAAKQIPLQCLSDKAENIRQNHKIITSALSEGYPVGISLKVYDYLGKEGPFIYHPDDVGAAKEEGYHAMVIAGYSEDNGFYIVRNSWGPEFGDEGYCYIPFTYIDDPQYLDFACIITEITDTSEGRPIEIPTVLADFAGTETEIRMAAVRNAIRSVKLELNHMEALYSDYYKYYQKLMLQLSMPNVQNNIRKAAEAAQANHVIDVSATKNKLEETFVEKLKEYKKYLRKTIFTLGGIAVLIGIAWWIWKSAVLMILFIVFAGLTTLVWIGKKWWERIKRRELQDQLDEVAVDAKRQRDILMEMQIRYHIAGRWLSEFHKLSLEIGTVYDRLVSFNETLRQWQKDYSYDIESLDVEEGIMFLNLDPSSHLRKFFNDNRDAIFKNIDLLNVFKDYQANVSDLEKSRERLDGIVGKAISELMGNFNLVSFLLGQRYEYLSPVDLSGEIDRMIQVGQPSFRNKSRNASAPVRIMMAQTETSQIEKWTQAITPFFPLRPLIMNLSDPNLLILLTLHPIE